MIAHPAEIIAEQRQARARADADLARLRRALHGTPRERAAAVLRRAASRLDDRELAPQRPAGHGAEPVRAQQLGCTAR